MAWTFQRTWIDAQTIAAGRLEIAHVGGAHRQYPVAHRAGYLSSRPSGTQVRLPLVIGVVRRCEIDPMPCSNSLNLLDPLRSDEPSSLREGFEPALMSKSHSFEQTSMDHIGEWMAIQDPTKFRREPQSASDLSQTSKEDFGPTHLRAWRQVLRVARIANDRLGRDLGQQKRRGRQTRCTDHNVGLNRELLEIRRDLHLSPIGFQLGREPA